MKNRASVLRMAAAAALLSGGLAFGQEVPARAGAAPERGPLMSALDSAGLAQPLEDAGIELFGHVEGSYTYNFDNPASGTNFGRVFDFEDDEVLLNQATINIRRTVTPNGNDWDLGGLVEFMYGADAGLIHSNGLFDWYDSPRDPENQFDLTQAYVDVAVPVGTGLLVRAGKFATLLGQEVIDPTGNLFYSHSYLFGYAIPFTNTGVTGTYQLSDDWTATAGITRGWDQSTEDNNDAIDFIGQLKWQASNETGVIFNLITGPEMADNSRDWRTVFDLIVAHQYSDQLSVALNGDFGFEENAAPDGSTAMWYGIATYATYELNDAMQLNGRAEWFRDEDGTRIGVAGNFYEATVGLTIKPFPNDRLASNLIFRPEVRYDWSNEAVFDDGNDHDQVTFGIDAIFTY